MNTSPDTVLTNRVGAEGGAVRKRENSRADDSMTDAPKAKGSRLVWLFVFALLLLGAGFVFGLLPRTGAQKRVGADTRELSEQNVAISHPSPAKPGAPLMLSGELRPATEASILARVNGYVRRWN